MSFEQIAQLTGANIRPVGSYLPQLKINRDPVDENDKPLPMGHFCVTQNDVTVYGAEATFRPFINSYQYSEYSPKEKKTINRSIIIRNFGEEAFDLLGGLSCGKIPAKRLQECSAEEQIRQKQIKCRRHLYGLVTIEDKVANLPVLFRISGKNFMVPNDAFDTITQKLKHQFFQHEFNLKAERVKPSTIIAYNLIMDMDIKAEPLRLTDDDMETFNLFRDTIERENNFILKSWKEAKRNAVRDLDDSDPLAALDLNDDISDIGN